MRGNYGGHLVRAGDVGNAAVTICTGSIGVKLVCLVFRRVESAYRRARSDSIESDDKE